MTELTMDEPERKEVDCKNKCGGRVFARKENDTWVYDGSPFCETCSEQERRKVYLQQHAAACGLSAREIGFEITNYPGLDSLNERLQRAARQMATSADKNLYLWGEPGRGKSRLAVSMVQPHVKSLVAVQYWPAMLLLAEMKATLHDRGDKWWVDKALKQKVVVLDDFGAQNATDWAAAFFDCLIDEWYRCGRGGLVVTSNFNLKTVAESISRRIASRFAEMCEVYELTGVDHRLDGIQ